MEKNFSVSRKILIVENQHEINHLLQSKRKELGEGIDILHAPSAEEGYMLGSFSPVDLLITEYQLPGMDGIELMHRMRRQHPAAGVILLSRQSDPVSTQVVTTAGADACFFKPLQVQDFLSSIEKFLSFSNPLPAPTPTPPPGEENTQPTLAELLTGLRQQLNSSVVLLLDNQGQVLARAGDLPDMEAEVSLLASLLAMHSAGEKVSHLLGQPEFSGWSVFDRGENDLVFVPLGMAHALLALGSGLASDKHLLKTVAALRKSRDSILSLLFDKSISPSIAEVRVEQESKLPADGEAKNGSLESLLDQFERIQPGEADTFWDAAVDRQTIPLSPDTISYDQAQKLGLTPGEDS